jgi:glycosyltransferase involved in cell wall biosynthesis
MKICMLLPSPFPPDIRVEKEARSLQAGGHTVHLLCAGREGQSAEDRCKGTLIHRVFADRARWRGLSRAMRVPYAWDRPLMTVWRKRLANVVRAQGIRVLHVHDLPLVKVALQVAGRLSLPVVFDMHENWPEAVRAWPQGRPGLLVRVLVLMHRRREAYCVRRVQHIVVVVDEQADRLVALGVPRERITVVMNTEEADRFTVPTSSTPLRDRYRNRFVVSYVGGFGPHRGLETAVEAMALVRESRPDALLLLVGTGRTVDGLRRLVAERRLEANVELTGWVELRDVPEYIRVSDGGLIPHLSSGHTDHTIPHKLFQYMLLGRPVVVTDARPLKRIVGETGCGLVVPSGDPRRMAAAIMRLHSDPEFRRSLGDAGQCAARSSYNWEIEARKLVALYARIDG